MFPNQRQRVDLGGLLGFSRLGIRLLPLTQVAPSTLLALALAGSRQKQQHRQLISTGIGFGHWLLLGNESKSLQCLWREQAVLP